MNEQIHRDGRKEWYVNGQPHRDNGQRHRDNGKPARIYSDGEQEWWVNGIYICQN